MSTSKDGSQAGGQDEGPDRPLRRREPLRRRQPANAEPISGLERDRSQDTPGRRLRGPPAGWPLWYSAKLDKMLKRPPRKIRRWVQETGARYEPGFGWYVERPRVSDPPPGIDRMTWYASVPPVIERIPIEPPLQWPVSSDVRTALILERLAKLADAYDGLPGPVKDPAEENFVTTALHALAAAVRHLLHRH